MVYLAQWHEVLHHRHFGTHIHFCNQRFLTLFYSLVANTIYGT